MKKCEDCGDDIHPLASHTGHERWCEDCFDKGLKSNMDSHWVDGIRKDLKNGGIMTTEAPSSSATLPVALHLKVRKLLFGLVKVPFPERMKLAKALELLEPEDENVPDLEKHRRFITRAQERKILHELWNAVSRKLTGATLSTNPFTDQE